MAAAFGFEAVPFPLDAHALGRCLDEVDGVRPGGPPPASERVNRYRFEIRCEQKPQRLRSACFRVGTLGSLVLACGPPVHRLKRSLHAELVCAFAARVPRDAQLVHRLVRAASGRREIGVEILRLNGLGADDADEAIVEYCWVRWDRPARMSARSPECCVRVLTPQTIRAQARTTNRRTPEFYFVLTLMSPTRRSQRPSPCRRGPHPDGSPCARGRHRQERPGRRVHRTARGSRPTTGRSASR